jgi:uncharacterized protein (DUF1501 family)
MQRRDALRLIGHGGVGLTLGSLQQSLMAATTDAQDYRAVVCIFLYGGNDQSNTVVPMGASAYAQYKAARPSLALASNTLLPLTGTTLGLHPNLTGIQSLYNAGKAALVANVGPLVVPVNKSQWNYGGQPSVTVPIQLFSHSDQQAHWHSATPTQASRTGWLGRLADRVGPAYNSAATAPYVISAGAPNLLTTGSAGQAFQLAGGGLPASPRFASNNFGAAPASTLSTRILNTSSDNLLLRQWGQIGAKAFQTSSVVGTAMNTVSISTAFPATKLGQQLKSIATLIGARSRLGQGRQVFYASMIGFDQHDNLLVDHAKRLKELNDAVKAFYDATVELGVASNVTSFTASDFGRALLSNGKGADHGWGGHHFVIGGAVAGGKVVGSFPTVALNGPEDAGQGRLIPTLATDQYAATIAKWFGADAAALQAALPNLGNFATADLGFLA